MQFVVISICAVLLLGSAYGAFRSPTPTDTGDNSRMSGFDGDSGSNSGSNFDRNRNSGTGTNSGRFPLTGTSGNSGRGNSMDNGNSASMFNGAVCPNLSNTPKCNRGQRDSCTRDRDCSGSNNVCCVQSNGCQKVCRQLPANQMNSNSNMNQGGRGSNNNMNSNSNMNSNRPGAFRSAGGNN